MKITDYCFVYFNGRAEKLKGKDIQVIIPATEIDGEAHLFYKDTVNGKISMKFDGGVFNKIGAGLFLKEN